MLMRSSPVRGGSSLHSTAASVNVCLCQWSSLDAETYNFRLDLLKDLAKSRKCI